MTRVGDEGRWKMEEESDEDEEEDEAKLEVSDEAEKGSDGCD